MEPYPLEDRIRSACDMFEEAGNFGEVIPLLDDDVLVNLLSDVEHALVKRGWWSSHDHVWYPPRD